MFTIIKPRNVRTNRGSTRSRLSLPSRGIDPAPAQKRKLATAKERQNAASTRTKILRSLVFLLLNVCISLRPGAIVM